MLASLPSYVRLSMNLLHTSSTVCLKTLKDYARLSISWMYFNDYDPGSSTLREFMSQTHLLGLLQGLCSGKRYESSYPIRISCVCFTKYVPENIPVFIPETHQLGLFTDYMPGNSTRVYARDTSVGLLQRLYAGELYESLCPRPISWVCFNDYAPGNSTRVYARDPSVGFASLILSWDSTRVCARDPSGGFTSTIMFRGTLREFMPETHQLDLLLTDYLPGNSTRVYAQDPLVGVA